MENLKGGCDLGTCGVKNASVQKTHCDYFLLLETSFPLTSAKISDVAQLWFGCGSDMGRMWLGRGSDVARIWLGCGSDVARTCYWMWQKKSGRS